MLRASSRLAHPFDHHWEIGRPNESSSLMTIATRPIKPEDMADFTHLSDLQYSPDGELVAVAAEEQDIYTTIPQIEKAVNKLKKEMERAARDLDFMEAARLRDEMFTLQKKLGEMKEH